MSESYVSVDVECDGPLPGVNSMLSIGAAAYDIDGRRVGDSFYTTIHPIEGGIRDKDTMEFWDRNPKAWQELQSNQMSPQFAMESFKAWLGKLPGNPVMVAYPAGFDFTWIYWYSQRFLGEHIFGWSCIDIKTLAWAIRLKEGKLDFNRAVKKNMPKAWFRGAPKHDHVAITDALGQGILFTNVVKELRHGRTQD